MDAFPTARSRAGRWMFRLLLGGVLAVVAVLYTHKALKNRSAFLRWRAQVLQIDQGTDIYQRFQYPNPPIMALLLRPLATLPPVVGAMTWFAIKVALALLALAMIVRLIESGGAPFPPWAKGLAVLLSLRPIVGDLTHGNVNILILFLVTAALFAYHRRHDWFSGLLLALAICCKVTPLLFVPYFAWKRQWRVLAGTCGGMALFLLVIPALALGWDENLGQLRSWTNQMIVPFVRDGVVSSEHPNQSLPGVVHRLLTHSPSFCAYPGGVYTPTAYHNVTDIGRDGARWLLRGAQAVFLLLMVLLCRVHRRRHAPRAEGSTRGACGLHFERGGWRVAGEFAFILLGMLILSERTWKHHAVTLALPFAVLTYAIAVLPLARWARVGLIAALVSAMGLMLSASGILSRGAADLAQVYGVYLWAFLILLAAIASLLACDRGFAKPPTAERSQILAGGRRPPEPVRAMIDPEGVAEASATPSGSA